MDEMNNDRYFGHNDNDCCGAELNHNNCGKDCCGPELKNNNCNKECCKPKELDCNYMDIRRAKCIPILAERIFDCVDTKAERMRYIPLEFTIVTPPMTQEQYVTGSEICIKKIGVSYDFIGLVSDPGESCTENQLPVIIDILPGVQCFDPAPCSPSYTCGETDLYNTYTYTFEPSINEELNGLCDNKGIKSKIAINGAPFYVCNLRINVYGKIGCLDFEGYTGPYSVLLQDLGGIDNGIRPLDFIETMCFPANGCPTVELNFRNKLDVDCIRVNDRFDENTFTFTGLTLVSLVSKLQAYSTIREELVVYTTPHGFVCDGCNDIDEDKH